MEGIIDRRHNTLRNTEDLYMMNNTMTLMALRTTRGRMLRALSLLSLLVHYGSLSAVSAWIVQPTTTTHHQKLHRSSARILIPQRSVGAVASVGGFAEDSLTPTLDGVEIRGPVTAVQNFLIVKLKDTLMATGGGILLPDQSKEKPTEGLVVVAGSGRLHPHTGIRIANPIRPGMSVLL